MAVAVGSGLACRWNKDGQAAVCFCSPADPATGAFHESLTLAAGWKLPVIFIFPEFESSRGVGTTRIFARAKQYGVEAGRASATAQASADGAHGREVRVRTRHTVVKGRR